MAEIKNSFISSKMNKDLDDRLIPNSEYRDALNIEVGKSESNNIGVLQNVLGNYKIPNETSLNLECIGMFMDNQHNRIYQCLTDYTDETPSQIVLPPAEAEMKITVYDLNTLVYTTLVSGSFLNFSKTNLILGMSLVEGLLFFTDNRNQPRKINYNNAFNIPNYYTTETQISVAKYAPVEPISMVRRATTAVAHIIDSRTFELESAVGIVVGMTIVATEIESCDYTYVESVDYITNTITTYLPIPSITTVGMQLIFLGSTMTNKADDPNWPGDPSFLEDKYVRFSYRFKFDDNEYSLMAPFTQIAFIPRQKGFFVNGDETAAYRSTVLKWMENNINNIELLIPLPDTGLNINTTYKITDVDILYKESDSAAVKVLDTISWVTISNVIPNINIYNYPYQSQKPYKTLTEGQTTRVYDIVPTRALGQDIAGNRVIYGNFYNMYTPPSTINYNTAVQPKSDKFTSFIEYPNHTLKQNRNYQVGFILADKFGRQSSVILSTVDLKTAAGEAIKFGGSTVFAPYQSETMPFPDVKCWFGNALLVLVNEPIASDRNIPLGTPGLYAEQTSPIGFSIIDGAITGTSYIFTLDLTALDSVIPLKGQFMRGAFTDYVIIEDISPTGGFYQWEITTSGQINDLYLPVYPATEAIDTKFAYTINEIGWYSYKVVVKQQQQEYYNAYLPGMLNGYPSGQTFGSQVTYTGVDPILQNGINTTTFPIGETDKTSHIVLINDNINKIPRDLTEVGPDQKQYRSSVQLFGRVENTDVPAYLTGLTPYNNRYATTITYDLTDPLNMDALYNIKPGDGIQCDQANEPVPNTDPDPLAPPTMPNPMAWYANTVVVSNVIDPSNTSHGIITFSPPNWMRESPNAFINFTITKAENVQYFPSRKADVVSSIATALDFNFLENTVDNIKGSSSINFYQLQTKPLIGRVSTTKRIGVTSDLMIPFLSVYETAPVDSLLALFWETTSTGYISDLNYDVLNGYNGPASLSSPGFRFFEDQNPNGADPDTGDTESRYITDEFNILNNTGFPLTLFSTPTFLEVKTDNGLIVTSKFDIVETSPDLYRFIITPTSKFVFDHNAVLDSTFTFTINVEWGDGIFSTIVYKNRLGNIQPEFLNAFPYYNTTIEQAVGTVVTMTAKNGSHAVGLNQTDLYWDILTGNSHDYFSIMPTSGLISLIDDNIPLGTYVLEIRVRDAFLAIPPTPLTGTFPYGTLADTIFVNITVGPKPVNNYLQYYDTAPFVWQYYSGGGQVSCGGVPGQGYGAVYIGAGEYDLDPITHINTNLPDLLQTTPTPSSSAYQKYVNVQRANGAITGDVFGLTQGALEWEVRTIGISALGEGRESKAKFILYHRASNLAPNNIWGAMLDDNNVGPALVVPTEWTDGVINELGIKTVGLADPFVYVQRSTAFVTSIPGEYCLAIWHDYTTTRDPEGWVESCGTDFYTAVNIKDANYSYVMPITDFVDIPPITPSPAYEYNVQLKEFAIFPAIGAPNGVPYAIQDASNGFYFTTNGVLASTATVGTNILNLTIANPQLVDGLYVTLPGVLAILQITNVSGTTIILSDYLDATVVSGATATFSYPIDGNRGVVYATTNNGIHVNQFYTDSGFANTWIPPLEDKFYLFQNKDRNYNEGDLYGPDPIVTNKPLYSAKFDSLGKIIGLPTPENTVQTAWAESTNPLINLGRNLYQFVERP